MALEDFIEPEVGVAVAVTAAIASPQVRQALRKGAVYGLAGIFMAGDAVTLLARGAQRGFKQAVQTVAPPDAAGVAADDLTAAPQHTATLDSDGAAPEPIPAPAKRPRKTPDLSANHEGDAS